MCGEDVTYLEQNMSYWCLCLDPRLITHHSNIGCPIKTSNHIRLAYLKAYIESDPILPKRTHVQGHLMVFVKGHILATDNINHIISLVWENKGKSLINEVGLLV
jgi:hypothetical protein